MDILSGSRDSDIYNVINNQIRLFNDIANKLPGQVNDKYFRLEQSKSRNTLSLLLSPLDTRETTTKIDHFLRCLPLNSYCIFSRCQLSSKHHRVKHRVRLVTRSRSPLRENLGRLPVSILRNRRTLYISHFSLARPQSTTRLVRSLKHTISLSLSFTPVSVISEIETFSA